MRAFVSYSLNDKDDIVMALLSSKLREKGFSISMSHDFYAQNLSFMTQQMINKSNLFVGVITKNSNEQIRVKNEWFFAQSNNIPNILLIEENAMVDQSFLQGNYISFNRANPKSAINEINKRMLPKSINEDFLPWALGGAALLAVIGLLSSTGKR